jgi:hypothetical protein
MLCGGGGAMKQIILMDEDIPREGNIMINDGPLVDMSGILGQDAILRPGNNASIASMQQSVNKIRPTNCIMPT